MIPKLNMSQLDKMSSSNPVRSSARVDPNRGLQDHGSGLLLTGRSRTGSSRQGSSRLTTDWVGGGSSGSGRGGGGSAAPLSSLRHSPSSMPHLPSYHHYYTNSGGSSGSVTGGTAVPPPVSIPVSKTASLGQRASQVIQLIGFDAMECSDVRILQRRLVELAEKVLQIESFYDEQQQNRCVWYQQRLAAVMGCLPMASYSGGTTPHPRSSGDLSTPAGVASGSSPPGLNNASGGLALPSTSFTSVPSLPFSPRQKDGTSLTSVPGGVPYGSGLGSPLTSGSRQWAPSGEDRPHRMSTSTSTTTRRSATASGVHNVSVSATLSSTNCEASIPSTPSRSYLQPSSTAKEEEKKKKKTKSKLQK